MSLILIVHLFYINIFTITIRDCPKLSTFSRAYAGGGVNLKKMLCQYCHFVSGRLVCQNRSCSSGVHFSAKGWAFKPIFSLIVLPV